MRRPRFRRQGDGRSRVALTVVTAILVIAAWTALVLHALDWRAQWLLVVAALAHYVLWAAYAALVLAALNRRWLTAVVAALASVFVAITQLPSLTAADPPKNARTITVLQANLKIGAADPAALVRLVRANKVELLATEELTDAEAARLKAAGLGRLLPHQYLRPLRNGASGSGIWSRYPISGEQDVPGFWLSTVRARVATPGGSASFLAVHVTPPYPFDPKRWLGELPRLRALLREQPKDGPVIAPGDYNATVDHPQFRELLTSGYSDATADAGAGYLPSYPNDRWFGPVIGIDHVLLRDATGTSARTLELPGSDHRALLVKVAV